MDDTIISFATGVADASSKSSPLPELTAHSATPSAISLEPSSSSAVDAVVLAGAVTVALNTTFFIPLTRSTSVVAASSAGMREGKVGVILETSTNGSPDAVARMYTLAWADLTEVRIGMIPKGAREGADVGNKVAFAL